ncbi:enoyl-CoA hydratase/isomerase family protein [Ruixingdingia sedimenti]|uniref:Enoyl-CoA hydratase-related protein n=1 Tax=Ruixingdingia sedimenti TaxID=3073604 RepID=A0ABU1FEY3_9RHOB|nr:enoyl-CoA hydratase-related protein [Xinfangfangia sp. LG-4]MDR5655029.1 enoyl-CoA hydratase-related protein [Xinfangfangia sp. LG-4]
MSLDISVQDGVAVLRLDRPDAMNAIDPDLRRALREAWVEIGRDDRIRVTVLTGAGDRAFCVGSDLKKTMPPDESFAELTFGRAESDHLLAGMEMDKPIIAAINGHALGGGLEIALACDIRIASRNAQFGLPEVRVGSMPGAGGTQRLPRAVGVSMAMTLMLTGDRIDADEAYRIGLVSGLYDSADLMPAAMALAGRIAANAPLSVRAIKRVVRLSEGLTLEAGQALERLAFGTLRDTQDRIEGRKAFQEKRKPVFRGK